jgi:hypothetical protein
MEIIMTTDSPPWSAILYGPPGVVKSTLCLTAPNPVYVDLENGISRLGAPRTPVLKELAQIYQAIKELSTSDFKTVVFDTIDVVEQLIVQDVVKTNGWKSIESPGFAKGPVMAAEAFQTFMRGVELLKASGKNVILIGHSQINKFEDPTGDSYDQISIKINKRIASNILAAMDAVLYADILIDKNKIQGNPGKSKATATQERVVRTTPGGSYIAKNRFNLDPVEPMTPKFWSKFS